MKSRNNSNTATNKNELKPKLQQTVPKLYGDTAYFLIYQYIVLESTGTIVLEVSNNEKKSKTQMYNIQSILRNGNCLYRIGKNYVIETDSTMDIKTVAFNKQFNMPILDNSKGLLYPKNNLRKLFEIHILFNAINQLLSFQNTRYTIVKQQEKGNIPLSNIKLKTIEYNIDDKWIEQDEEEFKDHYSVYVNAVLNYFERLLKEEGKTTITIAIGDSLQNSGMIQDKDSFLHITRETFISEIGNESLLLYQDFNHLLQNGDNSIMMSNYYGKGSNTVTLNGIQSVNQIQNENYFQFQYQLQTENQIDQPIISQQEYNEMNENEIQSHQLEVNDQYIQLMENYNQNENINPPQPSDVIESLQSQNQTEGFLQTDENNKL